MIIFDPKIQTLATLYVVTIANVHIFKDVLPLSEQTLWKIAVFAPLTIWILLLIILQYRNKDEDEL